jgi:hypothetical protein
VKNVIFGFYGSGRPNSLVFNARFVSHEVPMLWMLYTWRQVSLNRIYMPFSFETLERFFWWNRMTMTQGPDIYNQV